MRRIILASPPAPFSILIAKPKEASLLKYKTGGIRMNLTANRPGTGLEHPAEESMKRHP